MPILLIEDRCRHRIQQARQFSREYWHRHYWLKQGALWKSSTGATLCRWEQRIFENRVASIIEKFIDHQTANPHRRQAAQSKGPTNTANIVDKNRLKFQTAPIDGTAQVNAPQALCKRLMYHLSHPSNGGSHRRTTHERLQKEVVPLITYDKRCLWNCQNFQSIRTSWHIPKVEKRTTVFPRKRSTWVCCNRYLQVSAPYGERKPIRTCYD